MTIPVPHALQTPVELLYGSYSGARGRQIFVQNYMIIDGGLGLVALRATITMSDGRVFEMDVHATDVSVFLPANTSSGDATITTTIQDGVGGELNFITVVSLRALYTSSIGVIDRFPRVRLDEVVASRSGSVAGQVEIDPVEIAGEVGGRLAIEARSRGIVGGRASVQSSVLGVAGGQVDISLVVSGERLPAELYAQALREDEELILLL